MGASSIEMVDFDSKLDQTEVILEHPIYCGYCQGKMKIINNNTFKCTECGYMFKDEEEA